MLKCGAPAGGARRYSCSEKSAARYLDDDAFGARCLSHCFSWSLVQPVVDVTGPTGLWLTVFNSLDAGA